jgi:hypothetical protein
MHRLLAQIRHPQAEVIGLLFCGAPEDPATPSLEQANIYATLTELNHFADPGVRFTAQYGADGARTVEQGQAFSQIYLLKSTHRSPESVRDAVAHLGSYLYHELTTPLGLRLDQLRAADSTAGNTPFRSFGTFAVWFPRGLLLRQSARRACGRLLSEWQKTDEPPAHAEVEAACARVLTEPELRFEFVCSRLQEMGATGLDSTLPAMITSLLATLEEQSSQSVAQDDPGNWAQQALERVEEWVGVSSSLKNDSGWRRSRLGRALGAAVQKLAADWDLQLFEQACDLIDRPGIRLAGAEAALVRLIRFTEQTVEAQQAQLDQQTSKTAQAWSQLKDALQSCRLGEGGFSLFGGRSRRLLRAFMDHLAAFSRQRLVEEVVAVGMHFYATLAGRLHERLREVGFYRQRLRHVQDSLSAAPHDEANANMEAETSDPRSHEVPLSAEAYWDSIRESATARPLLPNGETDLDRAAQRFTETLTEDQWAQLDQTLQDRVLGVRGGLRRLCTAGGDLGRTLLEPMFACAVACLSEHLPVTDVAEVESSAGDGPQADPAARLRRYFERAAPLLEGKDQAHQRSFLLVSTSNAGKAFAEDACAALPNLDLVKVPGQADVMLCREQESLTAEDVQRIFGGCRRAYSDSAYVPATSPHARFDILDWVPLEP